jgi:hypothetical protein
MNMKGLRRKRLFPNLEYYPGIFSDGLKKNTINLRKVNVLALIRTGSLKNKVRRFTA